MHFYNILAISKLLVNCYNCFKETIIRNNFMRNNEENLYSPSKHGRQHKISNTN